MKGCPTLSSTELSLALRHLPARYQLRDRALIIVGVRSGLHIDEGNNRRFLGRPEGAKLNFR